METGMKETHPSPIRFVFVESGMNSLDNYKRYAKVMPDILEEIKIQLLSYDLIL